MKKKIVSILEARMGSSRLPGKVLMPLEGKPLVEWAIKGAQRANSINQVVLATSVNIRDDPLYAFSKKLGIDCYRGSEDDVLERVVNAITEYSADVVIGLTGDNPLVDGKMIDDMVEFFLNGKYDYVASTYMHHTNLWQEKRTFPAGISVQVYRASVLLEIEKNLVGSHYREHPTFGIYHREDGKYRLGAFHATGKYSEWRHPDLRLTIDTSKDFEMMSRALKTLKRKSKKFTVLDAIQLIANNENIRNINQDVEQRLAYQS